MEKEKNNKDVYDSAISYAHSVIGDIADNVVHQEIVDLLRSMIRSAFIAGASWQMNRDTEEMIQAKTQGHDSNE